MRRVTLVAMGLLFFAACSFCQTTTSDSKTLQDLLVEVRQLRQDLHTTTAAMRRAQILLHRVDAEGYLVRNIQERIDTMRSVLAQIRFDQRNRAERIKQIEDKLDSNDTPQGERKPLEEALAEVKQSYQSHTNDEQEAQTKLTEAEEQFRIEEAKLSELEAQLDRLDKDLASASRDRN